MRSILIVLALAVIAALVLARPASPQESKPAAPPDQIRTREYPLDSDVSRALEAVLEAAQARDLEVLASEEVDPSSRRVVLKLKNRAQVEVFLQHLMGDLTYLRLETTSLGGGWVNSFFISSVRKHLKDRE